VRVQGLRHKAMDDAEELDFTGLKCPLPSLMTAKALRRIRPGTTLIVTATDPLAPLDIRFLCEHEGHSFLAQRAEGSAVRMVVRKGARGA
jgi:tRNA 2-thiouridine synthesizing protein A